MDQTGLLAKIFDTEHSIYRGRMWMTTEGTEIEGRISYTYGLDLALSLFK